jgi:hypothetical protein
LKKDVRVRATISYQLPPVEKEEKTEYNFDIPNKINRRNKAIKQN